MRPIAVVGAGYVGLVTGACFAQKNIPTIIIENDPYKRAQLAQGIVPFYEPHLDIIVKEGLQKKTLSIVASIQEGLLHNPQIVFSCVGTPPLEDGSADLSAVYTVAKEVGLYLEEYLVFVNKSTVPVGTTQQIKAIIEEQLVSRDGHYVFDVASNPEFLKEGSAVHDFLYPDRIIVGVDADYAKMHLEELYKPFLIGGAQFLSMSIPAAELSKYASNAMLATRISFMNQLAQLADRVGADIFEVKQGMAADQRIGKYFLDAGIGYGGSCFPKDILALMHMGKANHIPMTLIHDVHSINHFQRVWFINRILTYYGRSIETKTAGILGLSFKPETDDIRCAPSLDIITELHRNKCRMIVYDPVSQDNIKKQPEGKHVSFAVSAQEVLEKADFLIILTEWKEFLTIDITQFAKLKDKLIFDGRNCFDPVMMHTAGITYFGIGRNSVIRAHRERLQRDAATKYDYEENAEL